MATRSRIGIKHPNGSITSVYCHNDGYYSHNGKILQENYQCPDKVTQLIALGSLSSLGELIGEKHDMDWRYDVQFETPGGRIDWGKIKQDPRYGWCQAHGRDRGDPNTGPTKVSSIEDMAEMFEEFLYLFDVDRGAWIACETPYNASAAGLRWHLLSDIAEHGYDETASIRQVPYDVFEGMLETEAFADDSIPLF